MKEIKSLVILFFFFLPTLSISAFSSSPEIIIVNTAINPQTSILLSNLDTLPQPVWKNKTVGLAKLNLNPKNILLSPEGHKYLNREIKVGKIGDSLFNVSMISLVALNIADYFSTKEALKYPSLQEGNPLMKPFVKDPYVFAAVKIGVTALSYINMKSLYKKNKPLAWVMSIGFNLAMSYIVSNNYRLIEQARGK